MRPAIAATRGHPVSRGSACYERNAFLVDTILSNILTLGMLVLLQVVLGFDNLLYISIESKRAPTDKQAYVRRVGIGVAIFLRIALLFILVKLVAYLQEPFVHIDLAGVSGAVSGHSLIVLIGGGFIIYTATKEIFHMISVPDVSKEEAGSPRSVATTISLIVLMNLVFSFDSILSAMALTKVFWVMASAIVIGGVLMIVVADQVSTLLQKNRMYEVLGLFVLFIVGVMLVSEGGHLAHLTFWGHPVEPMAKSTFYFVLVVLVLVDVVQSRYQRKLLAAKAAEGAN